MDVVGGCSKGCWVEVAMPIEVFTGRLLFLRKVAVCRWALRKSVALKFYCCGGLLLWWWCTKIGASVIFMRKLSTGLAICC